MGAQPLVNIPKILARQSVPIIFRVSGDKNCLPFLLATIETPAMREVARITSSRAARYLPGAPRCFWNAESKAIVKSRISGW